MTVGIITDSTADLPAGLAAEKGIRVIPLNVHFGTEVFRDGVDLDADSLYGRLVGGDVFPTTSQPSVGMFTDVYREFSETCDAIISVHISSKISGTYNSAIQAREAVMGEGCRIEVVDTFGGHNAGQGSTDHGVAIRDRNDGFPTGIRRRASGVGRRIGDD